MLLEGFRINEAFPAASGALKAACRLPCREKADGDSEHLALRDVKSLKGL
jgi:hypothetical protein